MPEVPLELAGLLCARICHDLTGPVGAFANGLELLAGEDDPAMRRRCLDLLDQSARDAGERLKLLRIAFGASAAGGDHDMPGGEAKALVETLTRGAQPIALTWLVDEPAIPVAVARVLINLAMVGAQALVRGGTLDCGVERTAAGHDIVVRAAGPRVVLDAAIARALAAPVATGELTGRTAPIAMLRAIGGDLRYVDDGDALLLGASVPARAAVAEPAR